MKIYRRMSRFIVRRAAPEMLFGITSARIENVQPKAAAILRRHR